MVQTLLFVGSLNRDAPYFQGARGVGLSVLSFDEDTAALATLAETGDIDNPTFLSVDPTRLTVYANSEVFGWKEGTVSAYRFDRETSALTYINKQAALGSITAYNSLSNDGRHLLVANYGMGEGGPDRSVAVFPIRDDGALGPPVASVSHAGSGPDAARQERAHAHCVLPLPGGDELIVADLGLDQLVTYRLGPEGALERRGSFLFVPGAGPRHIAIHPKRPFVFVMNELDSTVVSLRREPTGAFTLISAEPAVPAEARAENHCADLHIAPDGRFVYGSNRGHDSIVTFAVDPETGALRLIGHTPSGGATPRNFCITPSGRFLIVANQNGDNLAVLHRDARDGTLTDTGRRFSLGTPMCVRAVTLDS